MVSWLPLSIYRNSFVWFLTVICTAAMFTHDGPDSILGFKPDVFNTSVAINSSSAIVAIAESVKAFRQLPADSRKTFIYTGNMFNTNVVPGVMTFGIVKGITSFAIRTAAENEQYAKEGMRFYYADERNPKDNGGTGMTPNADSTANTYLELAEAKTQRDWHYAFAEGKGQLKL